ncbi:MAG: dicarboxylate/amino acid:cation symporter [Clostridia bacterium]|nr:dicarboxylate/amino acid:cation symporter [Clostridia bacterium]
MRIGLLPRLILGIIAGIIIGFVMPESIIRILVTFRDIFGEFLNYVIPFIIIAFVAPGIADLGKDAGKLLGITTGIAYLSTIIAGFSAFFVGKALLPGLVTSGSARNPEEALLSGYFEIAIDPLMGVMTALVTAFLLGLGMAAIKNKSLYNVLDDFKGIIEKVIQKVIIPILPFYIAAVFANMTYAGEIVQTMATFIKVFALVIILHIVYLIFLYFIASPMAGNNPVKALKNMLPAYFTAIGTQSSAATIPVTLRQAKNIVSEDVAEFVIPLCATIHLAGSTITLTLCSMAVILISGGVPGIDSYAAFILMLGITMIAAPGVPGGAVMAALGLLELYLGFGETAKALMIALYLTQDSFGTAANVTGDGAIAMMVDGIKKMFKMQTA